MNNYLEDNPTFSDEFLRGQRDCRNGIAHTEGHTEDYNRGYAAGYELEQIKSEWSEQGIIK